MLIKLEEYYNDISKRSMELRKGRKINQIPKISDFCTNLCLLCKDYEKKLPTKWFWYDGELSKEREIQVKILNLLLEDLNDNLIDENILFVGAGFVFKNCNTTLVLPSDLNGFKSRLGTLIDGYDCSKVNPNPSTYASLKTSEILDVKEGQSISNNGVAASKEDDYIRIIEQLKNEVGQELLPFIQVRLKAIQKHHDSMQSALDALLNELSVATDIIRKYDRAYPARAEEFGSAAFLKDPLKPSVPNRVNLSQMENQGTPSSLLKFGF